MIAKRVTGVRKIYAITSPEHYKAMQWCINNNIKIYPKLRDGKYILVKVQDGCAKTSNKTYDYKEVHQAQWDFYLYIYKKENHV